MSAPAGTTATEEIVEPLGRGPSPEPPLASGGERLHSHPAPPSADGSALNPPQPTQPGPSSPRSHSSSPSRSGAKRRSAFSPLFEEDPTLPPSGKPSTLHSASSSEEPASKKSRTVLSSRGGADPDARRRGQRLFGVLTSTLSQFKRESESTHAASAAKKRAEIQARLATKLRESEQAIAQVERKTALIWDARSIAEQIVAGDVQRKTLRSMKRRMASFLYTASATPHSRRGRTEQRLAPQIPLSISPSERTHTRDAEFAVYFLPGKTLPEQEDTLNEQEDEVDEQIDRFDDAWEAKRTKLVEQLDRLKARIREL